MTNTTEKFDIKSLFNEENEPVSCMDAVPILRMRHDDIKPLSNMYINTIITELLKFYSVDVVHSFLAFLNNIYHKSFNIIYNPATSGIKYTYAVDDPLYNNDIIIRLLIKNIYRYFKLGDNPFDESYLVNYLKDDIKSVDLKNLGLYDTVCKVIDCDLFYRYSTLRILFKLKNDDGAIPFDAEYKKVINKIDLLTQFVKKLNPNFDYRRLYFDSEQLGDYVIELRNLIIKNIRFRMAKDGLDKTEFNNDYVENLSRATESILFMMQSDISDNDEELMSVSNKEFVKVLDKYTNILSNLYDINFRSVCKIYDMLANGDSIKAKFIVGSLRLDAMDLCIKKFDEMQSK